ncbi:MAG: hypothetical protein VYC34_05970 [Planctomycetota bacterium]|nr:hypothetical protein [Planctomycetota bacterium]
MSAKWERSKAWDNRHIPAWAWPVKTLLRTFSSIPLAVCLLSFVVLYGVVASVPIGMLALIPTYLIYGLTFVGVVALVAGGPVLLIRRVFPMGRAGRFTITVLAGIALVIIGGELWRHLLWPLLRYDPVHETGLRLFPAFVEAYDATTLRRLRGFEMTEPQFYSWWPMRLALFLFVTNMVTATIRRIEFIFPNLGVLTVHTGIVVMALGSMHYHALKQEGDTVLFASFTDPDAPGPMATSFYDRDIVALWVNQEGRGWEQRPLRWLPRYNDYDVLEGDPALDMPAPPTRFAFADPDIALRVVGYASYADLIDGWQVVEDGPASADASPLMDLELLSSVPTADGDASQRPVADMRLAADSPANRIFSLRGVMSVEFVPDEQEQRWQDLTRKWDDAGEFGLVIRVPGEGAEALHLVKRGDVVEVGGYRIEVKQLLPTPPFPIITAGYEGAESSVAIVDVTPPEGESFERYAYHRFPEINQDILGTQADGRPIRRDADAAIGISFIDATAINAYLREDGAWAVRLPGGGLVQGRVEVGETIPLAPAIDLRLAAVHSAGVQREIPQVVPPAQREKDLIGNHAAAAMEVEVSLPSGWSQTIWLPFTKFMGVGANADRQVALPDGRTLRLAFSRLSRELPGIGLRLVDFEMIPYEHSDVPRDFMSELLVVDLETGETSMHTTRLNHPFIHRADFRADERRGGLANALGWAISGIAPNQYKFSQAGWDAEGWKQSKQQVKAGLADRPRAAFTILGVGNNPGIYIIAVGAVMMSVGIPWAFYVKPLIMKRRRDRLKKQAMESAATSRSKTNVVREEAAAPVGAGA